jgi:hypothetical protein
VTKVSGNPFARHALAAKGSFIVGLGVAERTL